MATIEVKNLKKYFGAVKAVDDITFSIEKGEIFGFLGPNGAGKTTTLRAILDFIKPTGGEISILGYNSKNSDFYKSRQKIGYLLPGANLVSGWTGDDHIKFYESEKGKSKSIEELKRRFSFDSKIRVKNLSTGNKQKLGLILALMNDPKLLIMDEPTAGLDPLLQEELFKCLDEFKQSGGTVLMSSHNLPEVEKICSKIAIIKEGKLLKVEGTDEIKNKKLQNITIIFDQKVGASQIKLNNIKVIEEIPNGFVLSLRGEADPFIKLISKYKVKSLQITSASLEDIFFEFYRG